MDITKHRRKSNRMLARAMMRGKIDGDRTYILVEGGADYRLWAKFKARMCELVITGGRDTLTKKLRYFNSEYPHWRNVAAIIDPDYSLIDDPDSLLVSNLLYDDVHSSEVTLVLSPALETVMRNTLPVDVGDTYAGKLRDTAIRIAMDYGYFRLLDYRHRDFNLSFGQVSFEEVIDRRTLTLDTRRVAQALATSSSQTAAQLLNQVEALRQELGEDIRLCRGHDVRDIMACLIEFDPAISGKVRVQTRSAELGRALRMAYEFAYFIATALYRRIRDWEASHPPFRIIRDYPTERTPA